ncbi:hypothetical protein [Actinokineospora iranica]|uniref:Uncharacterized protein n=1 Tax=Actinokineospora iranica TaxID=1271860 RepID=A0A1G6KR95_9PSEU|nr:hypothetical protein [Actinokineospora iranica]SDC32846.1 hypothetical protein SAMN05216174_1011024 [Actinokineospora iranica]
MRRNPNTARIAVALSAVTLSTVALTVAAFPIPASASTTLVNCQGTDTVTYTPAITDTPRRLRVSMRGDYRCQSRAGDITGVRLAIDGGGVFDCDGGRFRGTIVADWDNGQQSTMSGGSAVNLRGDHGTVVSGQGRVDDGLFAGSRIERVVVVGYQGPGCAKAGASTASAVATLRVTSG